MSATTTTEVIEPTADGQPQERRRGRIKQDLPTASDQLIRLPQVAHLLSIALTTAYTWQASGRLPKPIRIGRAARWSLRDIEAWMAAGCPDEAKWETMKAARAKRA